jgi:hypothetical protein
LIVNLLRFRITRAGEMVENTGCCSRGPEFNSRNPYGSSQLSITPHRHTCKSKNTNAHEIKKKKKDSTSPWKPYPRLVYKGGASGIV